jgi:hypothetical protein
MDQAQDLLENLEAWRLEAKIGRITDVFLSPQDLERIRQEAGRNGGSEFAMARAYYEYYMGYRDGNLTPELQVELQNRRIRYQDAITQYRANLENEPAAIDRNGQNVVLENLRAAALKFYKKVRSTKPNELYGADKETVINMGRGGREYQETVFDDSAQMKQLEGTYRGLASYIFDGVVQEIDKVEHGRERNRNNTLNTLGFDEYEAVKLLRDRDRKRERKYIARETHYGVIYEFSAENDRELPEAVLDFVKDQVFALSDTDYEGIDQEVSKIRSEAISKLEQNRIRLIEEGQNITETNPEFLRAKALAEAIPDLLGHEKMMYKGGEEIAPKYKLRFAANFVGHDDAIYLENPKAALQMHLLTTYRDGIYWTGHTFDQEKPGDGEDSIPGEGATSDLRREIEEYVVDYAATHDLFLSDEITRGQSNGMSAFEYREKGDPEGRDLRYAFDDNIERMLLDPGGEIRRTITDPEALRRHDLRVGVFRRIRQELDEKEGLGFVSVQERRQMQRQKGRGRRLTDKELLLRAESKRNIRRAEIQQQLRSQGYTNNQIASSADQIEAQIQRESDDRRQEGVRQRIKQQMSLKQGYSSYMTQLTNQAQLDLRYADTREGPGGTEHDKILWKWVAEYNEYRIKLRLSKWHPSGWDRVRVAIDRPTKVLDRALSGDELMAMYDPNELQFKSPGELGDEQKREINFKEDEARFGFMLARSYQIFHMQDTLLGGIRTRLADPDSGKYIGKLPDNNDRNNPNWETNRHFQAGPKPDQSIQRRMYR